jgi:glycosyltransferase involved in cell wall biosynthesis
VLKKNGPIRIFGFFGRIVHDKGLHKLIETFEKLKTSDIPFASEAKLLIAGRGEGDYFEQVVAKASGVPGVRYLGFQKPEAFYPQIDALVVPSIWPDPNPLVVIEAYAYGVPVIGADVGGISSSVISGSTGLKFQHTADNAGLLAALTQAMGDNDFDPAAMERSYDERNIQGFIDNVELEANLKRSAPS